MLMLGVSELVWFAGSAEALAVADCERVWGAGLNKLLTARGGARRGVRLKEKARVSLRLDFLAALKKKKTLTGHEPQRHSRVLK